LFESKTNREIAPDTDKGIELWLFFEKDYLEVANPSKRISSRKRVDIFYMITVNHSNHQSVTKQNICMKKKIPVPDEVILNSFRKEK